MPNQTIRQICGITFNANISLAKRLFLRLFYLISPVGALKLALSWNQPGTYLHCKHVENLALAVGKDYCRMSLKHINFKNLKYAALFHDIGKLCIPADVLRRKNLTFSEWIQIKRHPELGSLLLQKLMNRSIQAAVLSHHEEDNCTGYPRKVGRESLSLITRIVSTVDDYCAMTEARGFNIQKEPADAIEDLKKDIGTLYDPVVIKALELVINRQSS